MAKIGRGSEQAMIRLPEGMREKLKQYAERHGRSMNAEIVLRLEESFEDMLRLPPEALEGVERWAAELRVPVRSLVVEALQKVYPLGYKLGEFIDKWASKAADAPTREERREIIARANEDMAARTGWLEIQETRREDGNIVLEIYQYDKGWLLVAALPVHDTGE